MKRIEAIIQIGKLEAVQAALHDADIQGVTVDQVRGYGRQMGKTKGAAKTKAPVLLPKMRVEVVVPDDQLDVAVNAIVGAAKTGEIGDGKIFVSEIVEAIRIRTDERGDAALS
ncbi:MAG: P-II family nitrogen regulator [Armatimonadetes bacterium]|nr:P-II family nitrogen regulator [Armatimonadota bacterium]MBS1725451.1 P-II family nitrogen regulator [Armatimonadota bacterium]